MSATTSHAACHRWTGGHHVAPTLCGRCGWSRLSHAQPNPTRLETLSVRILELHHAEMLAFALSTFGIAYLAGHVIEALLR